MRLGQRTIKHNDNMKQNTKFEMTAALFSGVSVIAIILYLATI